jgi:2-polyprenyl-6-methoxyphenol hydroxylase-like FAD-dependent oxidoreductase
MTARLSPTGGRDVHTVRFPVATPPSEIEVLVVGAGPSGLGAAVELTAHGVQVAVVDRAREAPLARAGAMGHSARTVEYFRRWGLLQAIRDEWTFPPEVFLGHLGLHGVSVAGGWRVEALTEDTDGVAVEVADINSSDRRRIRARYVIGADGGGSSVRALAGIERDGERATEKRLRLIVRTGDISGRVGPAPSGTNIVVNAKADGFLAAVSNREWRIYGGPYPLDYEPSEDELIEIGRAAFGFDLDLDLDLELVSATTFYPASRIASTFRRRVLVLGDTAHVRTPGGNPGEGFGDVANLGWKLAAVLRGHGGEALLDSYDAERRAEIAARLGGGFGDRGGLTFDERYDASPVIWYETGQLADEPAWEPGRYEDDSRPGHRAPNGAIDPYGAWCTATVPSSSARASTSPGAAPRFPRAVPPRCSITSWASGRPPRPRCRRPARCWPGRRPGEPSDQADGELRRRGRFRREYEHETFRENLGVA